MAEVFSCESVEVQGYPGLSRPLRSDDGIVQMERGKRCGRLRVRAFMRQQTQWFRQEGVWMRTGLSQHGDVALHVADRMFVMAPTVAHALAEEYQRLLTLIDRDRPGPAAEMQAVQDFCGDMHDQLKLRARQSREGVHRQLATTTDETAGRA